MYLVQVVALIRSIPPRHLSAAVPHGKQKSSLFHHRPLPLLFSPIHSPLLAHSSPHLTLLVDVYIPPLRRSPIYYS